MLKAYKYRIYPNEAQKKKIEQTFGVCRLIYNLALQTKNDCYKANGTVLSVFDLCCQLPDLKKEYPWMAEVNSQSLANAIYNMDLAFKSFFKGSGFPKYKSKKGRQSFHCPQRCKIKNGLLDIPKIKGIKIVLSRSFEGKIKTVTISRSAAGKYFASILVDNFIDIPAKKPMSSEGIVGIDLGLKDFAIFSDGQKVSNPKFYRTDLQRLKVLQRRLSKKKKGSKNRNKARIKAAIYHEKIANRRSDFLHKLSTSIVKKYDTICVESLNVIGMKQNKKLSLSISDVGWGAFLEQLKYKCEWQGKNLLQVPAFFASSKICNSCGEKNNLLTLDDREWVCPKCGVLHDRDVSAAKNIRDYFITKSGWGTPVEPVEPLAIAGAMKQESLNQSIPTGCGDC